MKLKELLFALSVENSIEEYDLNTEINIATDKDTCNENSVLFALPRVSGGYSIYPESLKANPLFIVSDNGFPKTDAYPIIRVSNARAALTRAYRAYYKIENGDFTFIGVTGTNGKTTTATLIYDILEGDGVNVGFIGTGLIKYGKNTLTNKGYSMTTPDPEILYSSLAKMKSDGVKTVVMEVSSHAIALAKLEGIIFDIALFTNLSSEHLDFHKDMEEYFKVKASLFDNARRTIINIDDEYGRRLYKLYKDKSISIGIIQKADIYATDISLMGIQGTSFFYRTNRLITKIKTKLVGAFNVYNILMSMSAAITYGTAPCIAKEIINNHSAIRGRLEVVREKPYVVIDYAHTPFALENALKSLFSRSITRQNIIAVVGCGGERDTKKRPETAKIALKYSRECIITEDNSRGEPFEKIAQDILSGVSNSDSVTVIENRRDAIRYALSLAKENDVVAIIGKGHEEYIIDKNGKRDFSERQIIREYFDEVTCFEN